VLFSQTVKERQKLSSRTVFEAGRGLSPENYSALLVPVPNFLRKGTPSLAAFPKSVKRFRATSSKTPRDLFFPGWNDPRLPFDPPRPQASPRCELSLGTTL